jgi:glycine/serine hydroxymethyltransferase
MACGWFRRNRQSSYAGDVRPKKLTGKEAETILDSINITVNKNGIPFDPENPTITRGSESVPRL